MPVRPRTVSRVDAPQRSVARLLHRRHEIAGEKPLRARAPRAIPVAPKNPPPLIPLPDVRQARGYTCGAAALQAILAYFGVGEDMREETIAKNLGTTSEDGTEPQDLKRIAEAHGVKATMKTRMTLADLEREIRAGNPVMVAYQAYALEGGDFPQKRPWTEDWNDGHWSVVIGMDDKFVYVEDPSMLGKRGFIPREEFLARWHDTNRNDELVFHQLGIVFFHNTPRAQLNTVDVRSLAYVP